MYLATCGIGASRAEGLLQGLKAETDIREVVLMGCAGGLAPGLRFGDVVVASEVVDAATGEVLPVDPELSEKLHSLLPDSTRGLVACSAVVLKTSAEKRGLFESTGAVAVEMEAVPVLRAARALGLKAAVARWVLDDAAEDLGEPDFADLARRLAVIAEKIAGAAVKLIDG
ncbi:MAG: hypothetical protein A2496_22100 [Burkholderiales bacterium RIFOXYC12_FULL_60_6]|nr:MAG: hypothetical protein A2496_22100 [Burkholderiales bacterium RIFOXYC12_FULL_60_6]